MEYNTSREKLVMPEYGRNIQMMVDYALTIPDRAERTRCVATIANIMYNLFPKVKEDDNYKQKVWDHIAMISGYKLEVDSPYPLPQRPEAAAASVHHVPYPKSNIRLRLYGGIVQQMLTKAVQTDDDYERMEIVAMTAAYMKNEILKNGKDNNAEDKVIADIAELSNGRLHYDFAQLMRVLPVASRAEKRMLGSNNQNAQNGQRQRNQGSKSNNGRKHNSKHR